MSSESGENILAGSPTISPTEWADGVIRRGRLSLLPAGEGGMTILGTGGDGRAQAITVERDQLIVVASAAVALLDLLDSGDAEDEIVVSWLLEQYASGTPVESLPAPYRTALDDLIVRRRDLARTIDRLVQPAAAPSADLEVPQSEDGFNSVDSSTEPPVSGF